MMEERGFVRKQARVYGVSGKAWVGIRLKEHDELMKELPPEDEHQQQSPTAGNRYRQQVKAISLCRGSSRACSMAASKSSPGSGHKALRAFRPAALGRDFDRFFISACIASS